MNAVLLTAGTDGMYKVSSHGEEFAQHTTSTYAALLLVFLLLFGFRRILVRLFNLLLCIAFT